MIYEVQNIGDIVSGTLTFYVSFLFLYVEVCLLGFASALFAEFFAQLSTSERALALNSSLEDLVRYTRQGFQRLKQVTKTP